MIWQDTLQRTESVLSKFKIGEYLSLVKSPSPLVSSAREMMLGNTSDGIIILDAAGRIADLNPAARLMLNQMPGEIIGKSVTQVFDQAEWLEHWNSAQSEFVTHLGKHQSWFEIRVVPLTDRAHRLMGRMIFLRDITEHKTLEHQVEKSRQELERLHLRQATLANIPYTLNPIQTLDNLLTRLVETCAAGLPANAGVSLTLWDDYAGSSVATRIEQGLAPSSPLTQKDMMRWSVNQREPLIVSNVDDTAFAFIAPFQDMHIRSFLLSPLLDDGRPLGILSAFNYAPSSYSRADIDFVGVITHRAAALVAQARLFDQIRALDSFDELTGLFNRRWLMEAGDREFLRSQQLRRSLSAIVFDLDHLKRLNDRRGHTCGNQALRQVARLIRDHVREVDILGRWTEDEFILLLPETDLMAACHVAERIRRSIAEQVIVVEDEPVRITTSAGVAEITMDKRRFVDLITCVDHAMHRAKQAGRNQIFFADDNLARHFYSNILPV